MPATKTNILFIGATGYVGGGVLVRLVNHPRRDTFNITALVRLPEKADKIHSILDINTVVGSLSDTDALKKLAEDADIVIDIADSNNPVSSGAILAGLKDRYKKTGVRPVFIHTSGTALFIDDAVGNTVSDVFWDDTNSAQIAALPDTAFLRNVDLLLANADQEWVGYVKTYIVIPSTIYGLPKGPLVDAGVQHRISVQLPILVKESILRGKMGISGKGVNLCSNVHVDECADLFIVLLDAIERNDPAAGHGHDGYYIATNDEHTLADVCKELGKILFDLGKLNDPTPVPFTAEEAAHFLASGNFIMILLGANYREHANHSRAIGWKAKKTTQDLLRGLREEVEAYKGVSY